MFQQEMCKIILIACFAVGGFQTPTEAGGGRVSFTQAVMI